MRISFRVVALALILIAGGMLALSFVSSTDKPLRLGTNLWPGYEPLYVSRAQGELPDDKVVLVELLSASEVMRAFRNGVIDAAALTLDEVINLRLAGLKPVVFQVTNISMGADVILARPDITRFDQLKGRRIGVEATALGAYVLSRALELNQMTLDEIEVVHLEVNEHAAAFSEGRVDAVVTFDPVPQQIGADNAVRLFDSTSLPGEIVDVLIVRESLLEEREEEIRLLISAWHQALAFIKREPNASAKMMSERLKVSPEEVQQSLKGLVLPDREASLKLFKGDPVPLYQQAGRLAASMKASGLIDQVPELEGLIYSHYPES